MAKVRRKRGRKENRESVFGLASAWQHSSRQSASLSQNMMSSRDWLMIFCSKFLILLLWRLSTSSAIIIQMKSGKIYSLVQIYPQTAYLKQHFNNEDELSYFEGLDRIIDINKQNMGACCELFEKHQIYSNESKLKLLETMVQTRHHTENDPHFTYYLHYFDQHAYLERIMKEYRESQESTAETSSSYQFDNFKIEAQLVQIRKYLKDSEQKESALSRRMQTDIKTIGQQLRSYSDEKAPRFDCMIKMQIQDFEIIQGITRLKLRKVTKVGNTQKVIEEYINVSRGKHDLIFRQFVFPTLLGSKIQIITEPKESSVTIDVDDVMKHERVCNVLKFQAKDEDFGFIALRMQFFTRDYVYNQQKKQKLSVLERQLRVCLGKSNRGSLSSSLSDAASHKETFISEAVEEYHNEYQM